MDHETVFTLEATPVKFGPGAALEAGWELRRMGVRRALLVVDPRLLELDIARPVFDAIQKEGIDIVTFSDIHIEPTLDSLSRAAEFARQTLVDGFVALGGGSTLDTAKVVNLLYTHGGEIMDYVNPPIGWGKKPSAPLKPLLAIPTTSGSGSEATTVAVLDLPELKTKTGISHRYLRPTQALVDPDLTRTAPAAVTASAGLDVVCHAAESYLSLSFDQRPKPATPDERPPYQGSNPVADIWSTKALEFGGQYLIRAIADSNDTQARGHMMLSATMAGIGFGSAGVHIPHACAYPIAGLKHEYRAKGYPAPLIPHGFSVIVTAPSAFRYTYAAAPERHIQVAKWLAQEPIVGPGPDSLPKVLIELMKRAGAPSGLAELGYTRGDIPQLVAGALKQQRLLAIAPRVPTEQDLEAILAASFHNW